MDLWLLKKEMDIYFQNLLRNLKKMEFQVQELISAAWAKIDFPEKIMVEEVKEAFRYIKEECGFSHIGLLGHSLGGRIAVYSSDLPVSCLITINGALQDGKDLSDLLVPEMKDGYCLIRTSDGRVELLFERFKKELVEIQKEVILNYEGPILVCIGKDDPTIDPAISYRFSLENKTDRFEIEGANHTLNAKTGDYAKVYECIDYVMKWIKEKGLL